MSGVSSIFFGIIVIVFFIVAIATFYYISKVIGTKDTSSEIASAITTIAVGNVMLLFILAILSFMYIKANPLMSSTYNLIMIHLSLLFSLTAVSIASIEKFT
jgi:hypothetical protein